MYLFHQVKTLQYEISVSTRLYWKKKEAPSPAPLGTNQVFCAASYNSYRVLSPGGRHQPTPLLSQLSLFDGLDY